MFVGFGPEVLEYLLARGAAADRPNAAGLTPLGAAQLNRQNQAGAWGVADRGGL